MGFFDAITSPVASLVAAGLGYLSQDNTNSANQANAQAQMDFQERMSNSAYQRQVADMQAAGLNPMLAYIKGGGASTPSGAMATYSSPVATAAQAAQGATSFSQIKQTSAQTAKTEAETEQTYQQINNMKTDNEKTLAIIDNLKAEYQNLFKQNLNLTEIGNKMRKEIDLMDAKIVNFHALTDNVYVQTEINKLERKLKSFDVEAATDTGNLGREYNQVKGLLDVFRTLTRK